MRVMDTDQLMELAPHYLAMFILIFLILSIVQTIVGEISFWIELVIIFAIVFAYRLIVMKLGIGPSRWE